MIKNVCTNINQDLLEKIPTSLTEQKKNRKQTNNYGLDDCFKQETESLLTVDSKSIFSPKPSNINTPTKFQILGDCCDLLTQENVSDALERKSNNVK